MSSSTYYGSWTYDKSDRYKHLRRKYEAARAEFARGAPLPPDSYRPAPDVAYQPITVVSPLASELMAQLLMDLGMYAALHHAEPDLNDPTATMLDRQWLYWEPVSLARDGAVLWNNQPLTFPGVRGSVDNTWLALSSDRNGLHILFCGEFEEPPTSKVGASGNHVLVVPTGVVRLTLG